LERRLAAILAADVVGYSRLMGADETGTLAALRKHRTECVDISIAAHRGRIVKEMGDGILVEFPSVVEAVKCAIEAQQGMAERNIKEPQDRRIIFRIGINLGDVISENEDIHGDGVNVAARLEGLAPSGGICISDAVHEQVRDRTDVRFEDVGEQKVKNIERPLRIWHWRPEVSAPDVEAIEIREKIKKPTLAVSPFRNLSEDLDQAYFTEGICEDIVTGLSKNSALLVISQSYDSARKPIDISATDAKQDLGADFLLLGSVRKSGQHTRITAQLIDTSSGRRLWAERFDREMDDLFELQDEIVGSIVHALGAADGVIEKSARRKSMESSLNAVSAYDCYLRGRHYFYKHGDSEFDRAEECYFKAIELDEDFAPAYSALALLYFVQFKLFRSKAFDDI